MFGGIITPNRKRIAMNYPKTYIDRWIGFSIAAHVLIFIGVVVFNMEFLTGDPAKDFENLRMVEFKPPKGELDGVMDMKAAPERSGGEGDGTGTGSGEDEGPVRYGVEWGSYGDVFSAEIPPLPIIVSKPAYPPSMKKLGLEGVVVVEVGVDERGDVLYGKVIQSPSREFSVSVIEWLKKLKFKPAIDLDRKPFRCKIRLPIRFKLDEA